MSKGNAQRKGGSSASVRRAMTLVLLLSAAASAGLALLRTQQGQKEIPTVKVTSHSSTRNQQQSQRRRRRRRLVVDATTTTSESASLWHDSDYLSSSTSSSPPSSQVDATTTWVQHVYSIFASWMTKEGDGTATNSSLVASNETASNATTDPITSSTNSTTGDDDPEADWGIPLEPAVLKDQGKVANVVGGSDAGPFQAPYFVMFMSWSVVNNQWEFTGCGGTLISDRHVLTAGHCASGRDPRTDAAYVHAYQPFWGNPGVPFHYSKILSYEVHPQFDDGPNKNDVAIATLQKPVDPTKFAPVQLAPTNLQLHDGDTTQVFGFGRLAYRSRAQVKTLQVVDLPFMTTASCRNVYESQILDDMVCTSGYDKDACNGDSGGPLVTNRNGVTYQVAVVSWGKGCGIQTQPGVYASTQYHRAWIKSQVCDVSGGTSSSPLCDDSSNSSGGSVPATEQSVAWSQDATSSSSSSSAASYGTAQKQQDRAKTKTCRRRRSSGQSCTRSGQCCSRKCRFSGSGKTCV